MYEDDITRLTEEEDAEGLVELGTTLFREGAEETAFECYKAACKLGNAVAMGNLGYCYQYGRGVKINYRLAAYCYERAGELDDAKSLMTLGDFFYKGKGDIAKDPPRAFAYYQHACEVASGQIEQNDDLLAEIHYRMAVCKKNGTGTETNYEDAYEHYQYAAEALADAAEYGDLRARRLLAKIQAGMDECETHF